MVVRVNLNCADHVGIRVFGQDALLTVPYLTLTGSECSQGLLSAR